MLIVDANYAQASLRTRDRAMRLVRERFREIYGCMGDQLLDEMDARMAANIRSDGRDDSRLSIE